MKENGTRDVSENKDSRALGSKEINKLKEDIFKPFVELARKYEDELQLCFRGNASPKYVTLYYNNRQAFKVYLSGRVEISFRTARYWEVCEDKYNELVDKFNFSGNSIDFNDFKKRNNLKLTKRINEEDDYESLYIEIVKPMLENYAKNCKVYKEGEKCYWDFFKDMPGEDHQELEKKEQQRIFREMNKIQSGYFFYDLEFQQTKQEKKVALEGVPSELDEPDMLGVYFDEGGNPERLVFVEVKSKIKTLDDGEEKELSKNGSGLKGHIIKTYEYFKYEDLVNNRRKEACEIINNYSILGLRGLSGENQLDYEKFSGIDVEALFLFTDEARIEIDRRISEEEEAYYKCFDKESRFDIGVEDCSAFRFSKEKLCKIAEIINQ